MVLAGARIGQAVEWTPMLSVLFSLISGHAQRSDEAWRDFYANHQAVDPHLLLPDGRAAGRTGACFHRRSRGLHHGRHGPAAAAGNCGCERSETSTHVVADANGCYEFTSLPLHLYRVTARLTGFDNVTRETVNMLDFPGSARQVVAISPVDIYDVFLAK